MGGAMHPGSCSLKATLGKGGDRERPSSIPSLALKPEQLRIISGSIFCPTGSRDEVFTPKGTDCSFIINRGMVNRAGAPHLPPISLPTLPSATLSLQSVSTPVPHSIQWPNLQ